ncbi:MAG: cation:proton antiporter [Bacteroidota bacterium]
MVKHSSGVIFVPMVHVPKLIIDLALILGAAGIITLLFRRLKQPVVLGYILAGLLVSPNFALFPTIGDIAGVQTWADIGVIFLLFSLGLEFSFKKLATVGASAAVTGIFELLVMMGMGYGVGKLMGWPNMDCLFLGGIIAISSTTIIFRAFDELGLKTRQFTSLVMGVLIIEDLVAVLLMVLLSTLAVSQVSAGTEMMIAILKLAFFLCLWFLTGIYILPSVLKAISKFLSNETLLIVAIGLCLGMVVLASGAGFSAALGAFIMGSILAETVYGERIEHLVTPVKNLFGAIFFVSVGILINIKLLWQYAGPVILLTLIVLVGKTIFVSGGALIAGKPLRQSVQAGTSMSQIGEFSFIIANLGLSLKVTSVYLYPIAVGVSVITTFTTPYMIRLADPLFIFLQRKLPAKWLSSLNRYSVGSQTIKGESDWRTVFNAYLQMILLNSVIIAAVILLSKYYLKPFITGYLEDNIWARLISLLLTLGIMAPFIWALMAKKIQGIAYKSLWLDSKYNHGPLVTLEVLRNITAVILVGILFRQFFPFWLAFAGTAVVMIIVLVIFKQRLQHFYQRIEHRFLSNLNEKEIANATSAQTLTPWDAHLSKVTISPTSMFIDKQLDQLQLREKFGINIALIERGNRIIYAPSATDKLYPYDEIGVIGTDKQLQDFASLVETMNEEETAVVNTDGENIELVKIVVDEHNGLKGQTIKSSGIREKTNGLVVGIERGGERLLNPVSTTAFEWEDVIWLVGDKTKIKTIFQLD